VTVPIAGAQMTITAAQLKAAREQIGSSQLALAVQMQVGRRAIAEFEAGELTLSADALGALRRALEAAGLEFLDRQPHARLRKGK
jgi:transcriptional regulator with XRE-family HTH domain